jgi:hypothetical protein
MGAVTSNKNKRWTYVSLGEMSKLIDQKQGAIANGHLA